MAQQLLARRSTFCGAASTARVARSRLAPVRGLVITCYKTDGEEPQAQQATEQEAEKAKVTFQLPKHVEYGQDMCLVGEDDALGHWDVNQCIPMAWHEGDVWTAEAELPKGSHVEYKYIVRGGDDEAKEVLEWQPCNNLDLTAAETELTIRDAWEGQQHEVLPGTLPILIPEPEPQPEAEAEIAAADETPAVLAAAAVDAAAAAAAPAVVESLETSQIHSGASKASVDLEAPVLTAEEIAAAGASGAMGDSDSDIEDVASAVAAAAGNGHQKKAAPAAPKHVKEAADAGMDSEDEEIAAVAQQAHKEPVTPGWLARKQAPESPKKPVVAAAAAAVVPAPYTKLPTSELKEMCKERGLPVKGQRKDLLARLQQHEA